MILKKFYQDTDVYSEFEISENPAIPGTYVPIWIEKKIIRLGFPANPFIKLFLLKFRLYFG